MLYLARFQPRCCYEYRSLLCSTQAKSRCFAQVAELWKRETNPTLNGVMHDSPWNCLTLVKHGVLSSLPCLNARTRKNITLVTVPYIAAIAPMHVLGRHYAPSTTGNCKDHGSWLQQEVKLEPRLRSEHCTVIRNRSASHQVFPSYLPHRTIDRPLTMTLLRLRKCARLQANFCLSLLEYRRERSRFKLHGASLTSATLSCSMDKPCHPTNVFLPQPTAPTTVIN